MLHQDVINAWKDPAYRNTLSPAEREALPPNPAGAIEVPDEPVGNFAVGIIPITFEVSICCTCASCAMFQERSNLG
jgi:mersacidin/lichenicidin family type 2 lantibiotic